MFYFGPANCRKIAGEFLSEFRWRILIANFSALFFQGFRSPQKIHAQNSRPELSAFLSNFTFLNPKFIHGDFLLTGETNLSSPVNSGNWRNRSGSCSENHGFRIAQVVNSHSENGISHSKNHFLNSDSCSENTPELSESSENGLFTPRAFFLELGWSPGTETYAKRKKLVSELITSKITWSAANGGLRDGDSSKSEDI